MNESQRQAELFAQYVIIGKLRPVFHAMPSAQLLATTWPICLAGEKFIFYYDYSLLRVFQPRITQAKSSWLYNDRAIKASLILAQTKLHIIVGRREIPVACNQTSRDVNLLG